MLLPDKQASFIYDMTFHELADALISAAYRLATYANNHLIDDPAILAFIFC